MKRKNPIPIGGSITKRRRGKKMATGAGLLIAGFAIFAMVVTAQAKMNSLENQELAINAQNQVTMRQTAIVTPIDGASAQINEVTVTKIPVIVANESSSDEKILTSPLILVGNEEGANFINDISLVASTRIFPTFAEVPAFGGAQAVFMVNSLANILSSGSSAG